MANYNRIQNGMSYEQVKEILGDGGTESSSSDLGGVKTVMYEWKASGFVSSMDGGNMNAMFQDDKLVTKAQANLR